MEKEIKADDFFYSDLTEAIKEKKTDKKKRINMVFTDENYDRVKLISKATGKSMTEFVNICVDFYFEQKPTLTKKAQDLLESLK